LQTHSWKREKQPTRKKYIPTTKCNSEIFRQRSTIRQQRKIARHLEMKVQAKNETEMKSIKTNLRYWGLRAVKSQPMFGEMLLSAMNCPR